MCALARVGAGSHGLAREAEHHRETDSHIQETLSHMEAEGVSPRLESNLKVCICLATTACVVFCPRVSRASRDSNILSSV